MTSDRNPADLVDALQERTEAALQAEDVDPATARRIIGRAFYSGPDAGGAAVCDGPEQKGPGVDG